MTRARHARPCGSSRSAVSARSASTCWSLEYGDTAIAVDCGVMFPDEQMLGVDVVIPDLTYLRALGDRFKAIFLTHGHEDHIGALPYVLRRVRRAGLRHAAHDRLRARAAARARARRRRWRSTSSEPVTIGPFAIEPFAMTHSIPDAVGLVIRTPVGTVVHTGDFKIDQTPLDGRLPDLAPPGRARRRGRAAAACRTRPTSSTPGVTPSERSVGAHLEQIFREADGSRRRHDVLVAHPSHAAGDRPRGALRPQGRAGRPEPHVARRASRATSGCCTCADGMLVDLGGAARPAAQRGGADHRRQPGRGGVGARADRDGRAQAGDARRPATSSCCRRASSRATSAPISSLVNHLYRRGADRALRTQRADPRVRATRRRRS